MQIGTRQHGRWVTVVTIDNQPRRNAMTRAMMRDLADLWDRLDTSDCRCVILTGAGEKAFTSGADLSGDLAADPDIAGMVNRALLKTSVFAKPIVAAVNGDCIGGGVELMLSTDIRATTPQARFGLPEVKWSIYPFGGATVKLVQQVGQVHAMDLLLTGRLVDAAFAERINLVNRIVPADELMPWALATADSIAANGPVSVQAVKQQIATGIAEHARAREPMDQALGDKVRASPQFTEGVAAFLQKRVPDYR